ncbi:hsp90 co-chaperone Cdc37 [Steccherinum ochraceum]|uniref:Hsp90 chaperone protein kinase-targeting subunit n=1 Tax=Steccherinum ochraceum TaxID=92696 RepID=A0A4R0RKX8_9APHY|nr:hsp90 co-chaperone Cdc37 [Steccherinum ochraceum]
MPLNYSKWDNLELSDDSDIEGHPNVDKKSLVRWKQRDIHEKREQRRMRIAQLQADLACNDVLAPRIKQIKQDVEEKGSAHFSQLVEKFKTQPSPDRPPTNAPNQQTYDEMLLSLLLGVWEDAKKEGIDKDSPRLNDTLVKGLQTHITRLAEHQEKMRKDLAVEEEEQKKKITSDDMHDGFDSHYVPPKPAPPPIKGAHIDTPKSKSTKTEYEVLNTKGVTAAEDTFTPSTSGDADEELPELTPRLEEFSKIPVKNYQQSWKFITDHNDVVVPGATDALLVAAFQAQSAGNPKLSKQCVHQSLLLQYCEKLGKDGVRLFFEKILAGDVRAKGIFEKDVEDTYNHLCERVRISKAEEAAAAEGAEQIQLVPENPSTQISFNVPDGPPPEHLVVEGPGFEDVDIEDVRRALQMRWDVFSAFEPSLQDALKSQNLDDVNKVLGKMKVVEAEEIVRLLDMAGILNFSEGGIRDETGKAKADEEEEQGGDTDEAEA